MSLVLSAVLASYGDRLSLLRMNFNDVAAGTPVEELWATGRVEHEGPYVLLNLSNLMRNLLLYKVSQNLFARIRMEC